jgi:hypothetical protein
LISAGSFTDGRNFQDSHHNIYSSVPSVAQYQRDGLGRAGWLLEQFGVGILSDDQRAGLQIAIWKAEYETQVNVSSHGADLTLGAITFYNFGTTAAAAYAVSYLTQDLTSNHGAFGHVNDAHWVSYQGNAQDQIALPGTGNFVSAVPEPASVAMWGTALLVVSGLAYRGKRKALAVS